MPGAFSPAPGGRSGGGGDQSGGGFDGGNVTGKGKVTVNPDWAVEATSAYPDWTDLSAAQPAPAASDKGETQW